MKSLLIITSLLASVILLSFRDPPKVKVGEVLDNPSFFKGQKIELDGIIAELDVSLKGRDCFLKGEDGKVIRVRLKKRKEVKVYCEYKITGVVHIDPSTQQAYITLLSAREGSEKENIRIRPDISALDNICVLNVD